MKLFKVLLLISLLLLLQTSKSNAQTGFTKSTNTSAIQAQLKKKMQSMQTMQCNFNQSKNLKILEEVIKSKGTVQYKKTNKLNISYTTPYTYEVRIQNDKMWIKDSKNKTTTINTKQNNTLQSFNQIMLDCMTGNIFNNTNFEANILENKTQYLITLVPKTNTFKKIYQSISIYFQKTNMDIVSITMLETHGDNTEMIFSNIQYNITIQDDRFKI